MTIDEAIKILHFSLKNGYQPDVEDLDDAVKLSIEALKWRRELVTKFLGGKAIPLPGETKE
jgi:hypothetical protein